jgi:OOP family OmpA-OmpF porin
MRAPHPKDTMKNCKTSAALGLVTLAALGGPAAQAQDSGWYVGAGAGRTAATIDDARITSGLSVQGLSTSSIADHNRDNGYKLFGGYQFNRNFGLEAGVFDLGKFGYTATTVPAGTLSGDARFQGLNLDIVGTLPLTERFSVLGRVGAASVRARGAFSSTGAVTLPYASANTSQRSAGLKLGAGLAYAFTDALSMRLEAERFQVKDSVDNRGHVDMLSVGLVYRFGASGPPARAADPIPAMVMAAAPVAEPAPPPPPPPISPPVPRAPMRTSLSADSLFDFDRSTLKPDGRTALDKLAADLRGLNYDAVSIIGHTDRIGAHAYNLKLSTRRAESVSAYLAQAGIPSAKLSATGVDGAKPVTQPGDCKGSRPTPALIACLQPDRRVEVEVTGTR